MENVYGRFGLGPASSYGSSSGNWSEVYTGAAAAAGTRRRHPLRLTPASRPDRRAPGRMTPLWVPSPYDRRPAMANSDDHRSRARRPLAWGALATAGSPGWS